MDFNITFGHQRCRICEVLKEQIHYEQKKNKELLEVVTQLLKPIPMPATSQDESRPSEFFQSYGQTWTKRRIELEKAEILATEKAKNAAQPDSSTVKICNAISPPDKTQFNSQLVNNKPGTTPIENLEASLGIVED